MPRSVSVVGHREPFERENPSKVDQALCDVPVVQSQLHCYDSDTNGFYTRGFNSSDIGAFMTGCRCSRTGSARCTSIRSCWSASRCWRARHRCCMARPPSPGGVVNKVSKLPDGSEGRTLTFGADSEGRA